MKWRLTKTQVRILIDGKSLKNGRQSIQAVGKAKEQLETIDVYDAYDLFDIIVDDQLGLSILEKERKVQK